MLIAQAKRKENIVEYILYLWQEQDIIRSLDFDIDSIQRNIIDEYKQTDKVKGEIRLWYESLIKKMMQQGIHDKGHLKEVREHMGELQQLHNSLITAIQPDKYLKAYNEALPELEALSKKSEADWTETTLGFNALYGLLILKLKGQEISSETSTAMTKISKWMAYLAAYFREYEAGKLSIPDSKMN